jgi:hypothetical protein
MKMIHFLLLTMTSASLAVGTSYAASQASDPRQAASDNASAPANGSPRTVAEKSRPRIPAAASKLARPQQAAEDRGQPKPANPADLRSLPRAQSSVASNHGSMQNEAIYRALPVRSGSVIRPAAPSASPLRHRDPNAAVIGGAASPNSRSTASLDGASTSLKSPRN